MKLYEEIQELERKIFRAKEQAAFLQHQLDSVDKAIILKKMKLEEEIEAYNKRSKRDQEVLKDHVTNIETWNKKLEKLLSKKIKTIKKEETKPIKVTPKTDLELERERLEAKKKELEAELLELKEGKEKKKAPISEPRIVEPDELDLEQNPEGQDYVQLEDVINDRKLASTELRDFADELNGETQQIEWLKENHQDWIDHYLEEEGGNAIWRGSITKGFKSWCDANGYIIGF